MSTLAEMTGTGPANVLPGYVISPFTLAAFAEVEMELRAQHLAAASFAASRLPEKEAAETRRVADAAVQAGAFKYGKPAFDERSQDVTLVPFLAWVAAKIKMPGVRRQQIEAAVTVDNVWEVRRPVLEAMGYRFKDPNAQTPPPATAAAGQTQTSTGGESQSSSAPSGDSTGTPSGG